MEMNLNELINSMTEEQKQVLRNALGTGTEKKNEGFIAKIKNRWNSMSTGGKIFSVLCGAAAGYGLYNFASGLFRGPTEAYNDVPMLGTGDMINDPIIDIPDSVDIEI